MRHAATAAAALVAVSAGVAAGVGGYTFFYARGASYLTDRPGACANCHVMQEHFYGWMRSSHRAVAGCNDCHTPGSPAARYAAKIANGFRHSWAFTSGRHPDPLRIRPGNLQVVEEACRRCHAAVVDAMGDARGRLPACVHCHAAVGHP